jgi:hypothetical protein
MGNDTLCYYIRKWEIRKPCAPLAIGVALGQNLLHQKAQKTLMGLDIRQILAMI